MNAKVYLTLKSGVLDPQGQAVSRTLGKLGFAGVESVRIGKYIELSLETDSAEVAHAQVTTMCEQLLANTVIEDFRVEVEE